VLTVGEEVRPGVQGPPGHGQGVAATATVAVELLLDASLARGTTWNGSITATASGSSSAAAFLNPVKPSIETVSTPSRQPRGRSASHRLNTSFERPGTMSSRRAGLVLSRTGVRSMMTVTYLSPRHVWRHTCSSAPITATPSEWAGSLIIRR